MMRAIASCMRCPLFRTHVIRIPAVALNDIRIAHLLIVLKPTTHTQGFASQLPAPLRSVHRCR